MRVPALSLSEVDALVAERLARCLEVVDALRQRVAGEVDAVRSSAGRRKPGSRPRRRVERLLAEEVGRVRSADSTSGQSSRDGAVDAAVADEDDVVVARRTGSPWRTAMLVMPGPPSRRKTGSAGCAERARMRVTGSAISRDCGSARFSGHDERAAVGGVAAVLVGVQ